MAQLDLGQATLRVRDSQLQLHLFARANLCQLQCQDRTIHLRDVIHPPDLKDVWITGAPEMELRFFLCCDWKLRNAIDILAARLKDKLCGLKVWSELGFSAVLGTAAVGEIDVPGTYHFNLGLHKQHIVQDHKKHRGLPSSMANPPEISPPRETPTATLASVDISLEYCLYEKDIPQHSHSLVSGLVFNQRGSLSVSPFNLELELQGMAQPRLPGTDCDFVWLEETLHEALPHHTEPRIHHTPTVEPPTSHGALQRLFEIGMERLMTSKRPRDSEIFILEGASLASLAEIAPVVFKPGYREAINQRGVAMPIINKAISIMLQGSQSISLHTKLTHFISESSDYPIMRPHGVDFQAINLKTAIHSKLWDIAQQNTSKLKTPTRSSFLLPTNLNRMTHITEDDIPPMLMSQGFDDMLPGTFIDRQVNSVEGEEKTPASFLGEPHSQGESEDHLLDNDSETSFTDICDSTQSSLDTLFSAAASSQTVLSDDDNMLLSDYRDPSCEEAYVTYSYPLGNMQTGDEDLIMMD